MCQDLITRTVENFVAIFAELRLPEFAGTTGAAIDQDPQYTTDPERKNAKRLAIEESKSRLKINLGTVKEAATQKARDDKRDLVAADCLKHWEDVRSAIATQKRTYDAAVAVAERAIDLTKPETYDFWGKAKIRAEKARYYLLLL